jgi:hypothetical protein
VIAAIRDRSSGTLSEDQADIVSYVQQVIAGNRVDAATFERLEQRHGVRWLVELTTTAGHFTLPTQRGAKRPWFTLRCSAGDSSR